MQKSRKFITEYYPWFVLGAAFLLLLFLNAFYLENWLDSDMAGEMIFSRLLAEEGKLMSSKNWYYSTEFRILYTHLFMGPFFRFLKSWHVIRMLTNLIFYFLLVGSYFFMMAEVPVGKKGKIIGGAVLLLPFSETMMLHMQIGNTYMSHVIILFFCVGLFLRLSHRGKEKIYLWIPYFVLSVICGASGVRYMLVVQAPLFLASLWFLLSDEAFRKLREKERISKEQVKTLCSGIRLRYILVSLAGVIGCVLGYAVNVFYISRQYTFQTYESTNFIDIYEGIFLERLQDAFGALLMLLGYIPGKSVLSLRGLITLTAFVLLLVLGYCAVRAGKTKDQKRLFMVLLFYSSFLLNVFVFLFTKSMLVPRYYITTLVLLIPVAGVYFTEESRPLDRYLVCFLLAFCLFLGTAKTSLSMMTTDKNQEKKLVVRELLDAGYDFGYASYWNGNIIQELSNGEIEMGNLNLAQEGQVQFFEWSSMKRYYEADYPKGKVFVLLTEEEKEQWKNYGMLQKGKEIGAVAGYVIYHYDSNKAFLDAIEKT